MYRVAVTGCRVYINALLNISKPEHVRSSYA